MLLRLLSTRPSYCKKAKTIRYLKILPTKNKAQNLTIFTDVLSVRIPLVGHHEKSTPAHGHVFKSETANSSPSFTHRMIGAYKLPVPQGRTRMDPPHVAVFTDLKLIQRAGHPLPFCPSAIVLGDAISEPNPRSAVARPTPEAPATHIRHITWAIHGPPKRPLRFITGDFCPAARVAVSTDGVNNAAWARIDLAQSTGYFDPLSAFGIQ